MRKEIMVLGLAGLLGCLEERTDVSRIDRNVTLTKPEDCYEVKDIITYKEVIQNTRKSFRM